MRRTVFTIGLAGLLLGSAWTAAAQVGSLWLKEAVHEKTIYVFNTPEAYRAWESSRSMPKGISKPAYGPRGETVVFENQTARDLYDLKHDREAEVPSASPSKPPAPPLPTALKIGEGGEVRVSSLVQAWYVADDSTPGSGSTSFGNSTGKNTFRLRRAELKLVGKVSPAWGFEVMADFAKGQSPTGDSKILQDLAVSFVGLKGQELSIGQKKIALTDEALRSSSDLDFAERAMMTRTFSDVRQTGLFYKGAWGKYLGAAFSVTNGTLSNVNSDTNDTVLSAGKLDVKPVKGLVIGGSGALGSVGGGTAHREVKRFGGHLRYDGPESFPILLRAEYHFASDEQAGGVKPERDGWYASALVTVAKKVRFGVRWDELDSDKDSAAGRTRTLTGALQYFPVGKYANFKLEYNRVKQDGRTVGGLLEEEYGVFVLAAQASF